MLTLWNELFTEHLGSEKLELALIKERSHMYFVLFIYTELTYLKHAHAKLMDSTGKTG